MGIIFELYPEFSVIKSSAEDFADLPLTINLVPTAGERAGEGREYVVVPGAEFFVRSGERMTVSVATEGAGHGEALLTTRLAYGDGGVKAFSLPLGEWVALTLADGDYAFRFRGATRAPLTGLTVSRDPGLTVFYVGCLLFSVGVVVAMLLSYDELFIYTRGGKAYLAARSSKGPRLLGPAFERWAADIRSRL